jgi:hypothetical protein
VSRKTFIPVLGAAADIEIVTDATKPPGIFPGAIVMPESTPGSTVSVPVVAMAFPVAVMVAVVEMATPVVNRLTEMRSWPAGIKMLAGGTTVVLLDFNVTAKPPVGAGPESRI